MSDDLVKRLRAVDISWSQVAEVCSAAADEIERLRRLEERWRSSYNNAMIGRQVWREEAEAYEREVIRLRKVLEETLTIAIRNETGPWVARARAALAGPEERK